MRGLPLASKDRDVALLAWSAQHRVQKKRCAWDPNPPNLCAAGLSQTTQTKITRTSRPSGYSAVAILIPSVHSLRSSFTTITRNSCVSSGLGSFGPGMMPRRCTLEVRYLEMTLYELTHQIVDQKYLRCGGRLTILRLIGQDVCDAEI